MKRRQAKYVISAALTLGMTVSGISAYAESTDFLDRINYIKTELLGVSGGAMEAEDTAPDETAAPEENTEAAEEAGITEENTEASEKSTEAGSEAVGETSKDAETAGLSSDIYSYQVSIDGTVYQFPMTYADFVAAGWTYTEDDSVYQGAMSYSSNGYFKSGLNKVTGYIINFDINEAPISECYIGGISFYNYNIDENTEILLPGGIRFGESVPDDIIKAAGEPTDIYDSDYSTQLIYEGASYTTRVQLFCTKDDGSVLTEVDVRNLETPADFVYSEASEEIPAITAAYTAPEEISDDLFDYTFSYDGALYQLPFPVSELEKNGWSLKNGDSYQVIAGGSDGLSFSMDSVNLFKTNVDESFYVENYDRNATTADHCFVTSMYVGSYDEIDFEIAKGIRIGMTMEELETALDGIVYEKDERDDGYIYYTISNPKTDDYFDYNIIISDGTVISIDFNHGVSLEELYAAYGVE